LAIALGAAIVSTIAAGGWYWLHRPTTAVVLRLSGRLEGYETDIGAKIPGRIAFVAVREGDAVKRGQVIVQLDDAEVQAQLRGATAQLAAAKQQAEQARSQIGVIQSNLKEAEFNWQQSKGDTLGKVAQAESTLAGTKAQLVAAQAQVAEAQSKLRLAKISRDRYAGLRQDGAVPQERLDQAETELETAQAILTARQAAVGSAQKQVESAQGALVQAQTTRFNPIIRIEQRAALRQQLAVAQAQLKAAQEQVAAANAARQEIQAQIAYLNVVSPINGVVTARSVEPGAVVTSGKTLLTVINPDTVYLRGFILEGDIGKVRVGQAARVFLDSAPQRPLAARVTAIDTQASFTPENIYFRQDRVRQVFGVKLGIDQPAGLAKPGMPADAEILLDRAAAP
jgi:HlyD family secretion protein